MAGGFDPHNPPFDRLTQGEVEEVRAAIDIGYFAPGEIIVAAGSPSDHLHVVIKGQVEVRQEDALAAVLGPKDSFDSRALVHGAAGEEFRAAEETLCHLIPRELVRGLIARNPGFAAFFYSEISQKLDAFARDRRGGGAVESVLRARVREAAGRSRAVFIDGSETLEAAGHCMAEADTNALFVRDGGRTGVVTGMNLSKAVVLRRLPLETPVREISHFDVVAVEEDDFVFEALLAMTRHDKRRVAVRATDEGAYTGFLEDIDILGLVAGNSQLIPGRIDRARGLEELGAAAREIQSQVERLHRQGVKVEAIAEITSDLNRRLYLRLFELLAPPSVREHGCLLVMGSEGRGEQTVRTDQDNGLLLARPVPETELAMFREAFSGALDGFGFPPCPGNVMVRNPLWSQPVEGLVRQLRAWVLDRTPEAAMNLAIFADAVAVAGRPESLAEAKAALAAMLRGEGALLARFANLIETFATPSLGVLSTLMATVGVAEDEIDIKKAGIFPIVHGVRTLALDRGVGATATDARIEALGEAGALDPGFGRELVSALRVFMEYRLRSQLEAVHRGDVSREALIRPGGLSAADRDILRDGLRIVRRFRETIRTRYRLGAF
jgi:CBS domain-containing protein